MLFVAAEVCHLDALIDKRRALRRRQETGREVNHFAIAMPAIGICHGNSLAHDFVVRGGSDDRAGRLTFKYKRLCRRCQEIERADLRGDADIFDG